MKKIIVALFFATLLLLTNSAFATNCNDFVAGPNKAMTKYTATVGAGVYHNLYFNSKGNFTMNEDEARSVYVDFVIKAYQLPTDAVKKIYFRFAKAETLGTRTANRRLVCKFTYEDRDGFVNGSDYYILDVEPTSDTTNITAYWPR